MGKAEGSWSGMRKYLEQEMLAEPLRGRVRYNCTTYVGMDGCRIFEVYIDGRCFKQFSWETVNSYFLRTLQNRKTSPLSIPEYWAGYRELLAKYPVNTRTEYMDGEFCQALEEYRGHDIQTSICSGHPVVRMFAILDRRVGRRTLEKLKEDMAKEPEWLQEIYCLRTSA